LFYPVEVSEEMKVLKKFSFSFFYVVALSVINVFHYRLENFLFKLTGENFVLYLIYALFISFSVLLLIKVLPSKKNLELSLVLLTMGSVFFFLVTRTPFLAKLGILEFFLLGILMSVENKKSKSVFPFILLVGTAFLIEWIHNLSFGSRFYYLDAWLNSLTGLSAYIATFLLI